MSNKSTGASFEREVQNILNKRGVCVRVGGSGTGKINVCDLVYIRGAKVFLIECKTAFSDKFYPYEREILQFEELKKAAKISGARAILLIKFKKKKGRPKKIVFIDLEEYNFKPVNYEDYKDSLSYLKDKF